jgi:moderate conductance mechanosensitive channel
MNFKEKSKNEKIRIIVLYSVILLLVLIGSFANIIFPDTQFAAIISNSIGKFFNIIDFFANNYVIILESVTVVIFIWILNKLLILVVALLTKKGQRSETIGRLLNSVISYLSVLIAIFLILSAWGVQTPTLLAGAGILGLALSFGAQSLIEDIFCGLFIIFEKQFQVGDIVEVLNTRGTVREIGLRITKIEDFEGNLLIINNSDIRGAINTSANLSLSKCDISVSYGQDIEKVEKVINDNLLDIAKKIPLIKGKITYAGVQQLADSSVVLRIIAETDEINKFRVLRSLNRELKILFDKNQIEIPFPQLVIHQKEQK